MAGEAGARTSGRRALAWALLSALGLAGNAVALSIGFDVDFILGSVFGLVAVALFGPAGVGAAVVAAAYTFVLWRHPYAIVIFGCEAAFVAAVRRRRPDVPLLGADLAYWLVLGVPLVFVFYFGVMSLGLRSTGIVALKQALNGVSNAVLAGVLLGVLPLRRWLGLGARQLPSSGLQFLEAMAFLLLVPSVAGLVHLNHHDVTSSQRALATRVRQAGAEVSWFVDDWLGHHRRAAELLAHEAEEVGVRPSEALQGEVEAAHRLFPSFHNMFVADGTATTIAFHPPVNERGESTLGLNYGDRAWFRQLREERRTIVSDVFSGRGGVFRPTVAIAAPVLRGGEVVGIGLGAVNLDRLEELTHEIAASSNLTITVLDRQGNVVTSTDRARAPLSRLEIAATPGHEEVLPGVSLLLPPTRRNVSVMSAWKGATLFTRRPVAAAGWTVVVEGPLAPLQRDLYDQTIRNMGGIFVLLLAAGAASAWFGRHLTRPLGRLAAVSADIPARIEADARIDWPVPETTELATLTENFRATAEALRDEIGSLEAHGRRLEDAVAERTAEIDAYARSQRVLLDEVNHRVKNNLALIGSLIRLERRGHAGEPCGELLGAIEGRVNALGTVHSMLSSLEWRPVRLDELCRRIVAGSCPDLEVAPSPVVVAASQAHHLAIVLNELAANTAKHAGAAPVRVEVCAREGQLGLRYRDRGPGFPAEVLRGDVGAGHAGLELVRGTVRMSLRGEVTFSNGPDGGAAAELWFAPEPVEAPRA